MKLLNVHKYRPGDRLQNIDCSGRIHIVVDYDSMHGEDKLYRTLCDGIGYLLDERYLDIQYRRIQ